MGGTGLVLIVLLGLVFCAFFSGAEIAILTMDRAALKRLAKAGSRSAIHVERYLERPHWLLGTTLAGGSLSLVLVLVPAVLYSLSRFQVNGPLITFVVLAPLFLLLGLILPKIYFLPRTNQSSLRMIVWLRVFSWIFFPLLVPLIGLIVLIEKTLGRGRESTAFWYTRDELKALLTNSSTQFVLDKEGRQMIDRIFEFSETMVEEAMVPLVEVEAIEETTSVGEAMRRISNRMYSRYPVYQDRIDNVIGLIETVDLLEAKDLVSAVRPWVKEVSYVPYNKPVDELLFTMQKENFSFAVVVDEYGGCIGIITREDIVEEIVGEIEDEHDQHQILYRRLGKGRFTISARMEIDEVNEVLGWDLPDGEYETLGGFILSLFRRVPRAGEKVRYRDLVFTINEANERAVQEILVQESASASGKEDEKKPDGS